MPYIDPVDRATVDKALDPFLNQLEEGSAGECNYIITRLLHRFIEIDGKCYDTLNTAIGILEAAKLELYRTIAAPYENKKAQQNGCVSKLDEPFHGDKNDRL